MKSKDESLVRLKSIAFAIRIVNLYKFLVEHKEFVLSKQVLRSGTSIGANIHEAIYAQSKNDFIHKMSIALKESSETEYWLLILKEGGYVDDKAFQSLNEDCLELIKMTAAIVKTSKGNLKLLFTFIFSLFT